MLLILFSYIHVVPIRFKARLVQINANMYFAWYLV